MSDEGHGHEIIIVKRHGGGHDEHHGGVWKIAFADFMTAMMAFFLVMWLISANDKTKAVIAKYFNPIELVDSMPQPRGLNDSKKEDPNAQKKAETAGPDADGKDTKPPEKSSAAKESPPSHNASPAQEVAAPPRPEDKKPVDDADQSARHKEVELIVDPYAVIAEIAEKKKVDPPPQSAPATTAKGGGAAAIGRKPGEAFRDPFEPTPVVGGPNLLAAVGEDSPPSQPSAEAPTPPAPPPSSAPGAEKAESPAGAAVGAGTPASPPHPAAAPELAKGAGDKSGVGDKPGAAEAAASAPSDGKPLPLPALRSKVAALVKENGASAGAGTAKVDVRHTDEGTLISLTDSSEFSMFASASARPSAQTVALMEKIGRLLKNQKGAVTIRGFTDNRPFRSDTYDNWRLSTERAHIAQYMLQRGGLEDARIERIEGYADRRPRNLKDPASPENRRIEILLRDTAP